MHAEVPTERVLRIVSFIVKCNDRSVNLKRILRLPEEMGLFML